MRVLGLRRLIFLGALLAVPLAGQAGDPRLDWRTIESEHFRVHYYQGLAEVARAVAVRAERAHRALVPLVAPPPDGPTHIVLTDNVDSANGSASVLPYNLIYLFAVPPEGQSVLADYDDWLNLLVTHEYTHILHIGDVSGIPKLVNTIVGLGMGKVYAPNQLQPRWFIEGLATYQESARTTGGRARSRMVDMYLRSAVLEHRFPGLDKLSSGLYDFPHGQTAYLFGATFLKYIADRFGEGVLAAVSHLYGGRPVPFGINHAISDATGMDYEQLWRDFHDSLVRRYEVQRAEVEARGRTSELPLTAHHEWTDSVIGFPGTGEVLYVRNDGYRRPAIMTVAADGKSAPRVVREMVSLGSVAPLPDGSAVVSSEGDVCRTVYYYNDLFLTDLKTGRRRRLTTCARTAEPSVAPDGRRIAYTVQDGAGKGPSLAFYDLESGTSQTFASDEGARVFTPVWSPDGQTLTYSQWTKGGYRDLYELDLKTGQRRRLLRDRAQDLTPRYSPDGRYILFASDRSGVYNIYAIERQSGRLFQVTNVLGGAFEPDVVGGRLVYQGFSSSGYDVYTADYEPARWKEALPFVSEREDAPPVEPSPPGEVVLHDKPYSAWSTAHPWRIANVRTEPGSFGQLLELDLAGSDATGIHSWNLHLEQGIGGRGETNEALSYSWDRLWTPLSLVLGHRTQRTGGLVIDMVPRPYAEEQWSAQGFATLPIVRRSDHSASIGIGYHYFKFGAADALDIPLDPGHAIARVPEQGALAGMGAGFSYSNARRYSFSVSAEEGRSIGLQLNLNHEVLGGTIRTVDVTWGWTEYLRMPWLRHTLQLHYSGGIGSGGLEQRGFFALGGFGDNSPLSALLLCAISVRRDKCTGGTPSLRGYPPGAFVGDQYHLTTAEYRFPIRELEKGASTLPFYANRLVGAVYADLGGAYFGSTKLENFKLGVGGEVGLNLTLGYAEGASFRLGYARGLMSEGENQIYFQFQLGQLY